ncbi:MAG: sigma-54 dependent transcriptional regulator [bacterium]|nr:sigma-54 dependent transcriptional regulator [bacterium]
MRKYNILIVDDEEHIRTLLKESLEDEGYEVSTANNAVIALDLVKDNNFDLILLDLRMPIIDGVEFLTKIREINSILPVIVITGHGTIKDAIATARLGIFDFIEKPLDFERLLSTIKNCLKDYELKTQRVLFLWERENEVFESKSMQRVKLYLEKECDSPKINLIFSQKGGDRLTPARFLHEISGRKSGTFKYLNLALIPPKQHNSAVFGPYGVVSNITTGTILLDMIEESSDELQEEILNLFAKNMLEENKGVSNSLKIVCGTVSDIKILAREGKFNNALSNILEDSKIVIPPLSMRKDDIPYIFNQYVKYYTNLYNIPLKTIQKDVITQIKKYPWPGDIQELKNFVRNLCLTFPEKTTIDLEDLMEVWTEHKHKFQFELSGQIPLKEAKEQFEKEYITYILNENNWGIRATAKILKIERTYLYSKIKRYNLQKFK